MIWALLGAMAKHPARFRFHASPSFLPNSASLCPLCPLGATCLLLGCKMNMVAVSSPIALATDTRLKQPLLYRGGPKALVLPAILASNDLYYIGKAPKILVLLAKLT